MKKFSRKIDLESIAQTDKDANRLGHLYTTFNQNVAALKGNYQKIIELTNKGEIAVPYDQSLIPDYG